LGERRDYGIEMARDARRFHQREMILGRLENERAFRVVRAERAVVEISQAKRLREIRANRAAHEAHTS
ncbi:MAG: hypothetical protein ABJB66_16175, partial [Gemmatimonadaceae bacterium]